jgi:hypothetical protein
MAGSAVTIEDFINLLKPDQLEEISFIIETAVSNLTTTAMVKVVPADVKALGPLITAVRTAGTSTALTPPSGTTGAMAAASMKKVIDAYATIPTSITAYTTQNTPLPSSGASTDERILAGINPAYNALIRYIKKSLDDFCSVLLVTAIQQNASKKDSTTLSALSALVVSYTSYLNGIIKAFKFASADLHPNYDSIITNVEKTLQKLGTTLASPTNIPLSEIYSLVQPLPPVVAKTFVAPTQPKTYPPNPLSPDGSIKINSDVGYDFHGAPVGQFYGTTRILCVNQNISTGEPMTILPAPGWGIAGQYVQPGTTVTGLQMHGVQISPWVGGLIFTLSKPMVGLKPAGGDVGMVYTYTFTPPNGSPERAAAIAAYSKSEEERKALIKKELDAYTASMNQYNLLQSGAIASLPRPTPDAPIVEIAKSLNKSLSNIVKPGGLTPFKSQRTIAAIKQIPSSFGAVVTYILNNKAFLVAIGNQVQFVVEYFTPIHPIPAATQRLYDTLSIANFETNLTQPTTGILTVLMSRYTQDFSLNLLQKIISKANSSLSSDAQKRMGASILSKVCSYYIDFLNSIINIFSINLGADIAINPHITLVNKVLSKIDARILIAPAATGGGRKRISRRHKKVGRKLKHKNKHKHARTRRR